jgi:futalosine hydrolase
VIAEDVAPLALVCSVALEAEPVLAALGGARPVTVGRRAAVEARAGDQPVIVIPGGMGKTNAAQALTALLETRGASGVVDFGVGGAYPGSGLRPGGVALATAEIYGDEGVAAPAGWLDTQEIGIPLLQAGEIRRFNDFPVDAALAAAALDALRAAGIGATPGPFVTVSCCSGTTAHGEEIARRFGAVCESMEGAACAHVAALYELPFLEVRGVSNLVEDRDLTRWKLRDAARAAADAVVVLARAWRHLAG